MGYYKITGRSYTFIGVIHPIHIFKIIKNDITMTVWNRAFINNGSLNCLNEFA